MSKRYHETSSQIYGRKEHQITECLADDRPVIGVLTSQLKFSIMEPSETTLSMQQQLNLMSASFVPNFIRNQEDDDQSFDQTGKQFVFKQQ
jgi:hypothetical protein